MISIGVVFLLNNLGMLAWDVWFTLLRMWPLLLVAAGLDVMIGRRSVLGAIFSLMIILALLAGGIWFFSTQVNDTNTIETRELDYPTDDVDHANVTIGFGLGSLNISPLTKMNKLATGNLELAGMGEYIEEYQIIDDIANLTIRDEGTQFNTINLFEFPFWGNIPEWEINLSDSIPLVLKINTGVGVSVVDLSGLTLINLDVDVGVGKTEVYLPSRTTYSAEIKGGVGQLIVYVPSDTAMRITIETGLGNTNVRGDFDRDGNVYYSNNYQSFEQHIELLIHGGVGSVRIQELGE
jgi:hypothetical protein